MSKPVDSVMCKYQQRNSFYKKKYKIPAGVSEFFIDIKILPIALWSWVDSTSNRNEYLEYFLKVKAAGE